ncbi:MAG: CvpA family protein [Flammeovirgaceae bacterium]
MDILFSYAPNLLLDGSYFASYVRVIDIVLAAMLLWGGYKGYRKGFVLEVISTIVFVAGILILFYGLSKLFQSAKGYMVESLKPTSFIFFIIAFIALSLITNSIGKKLRSAISYSIFGDLDAFAGMLLGVLKYAIFLSLIIWLMERVGYQLPAEATADSQIYPLLRQFQPWLIETGQQLAPVIGRIFEDITDLLKDRSSPPAQ